MPTKINDIIELSCYGLMLTGSLYCLLSLLLKISKRRGKEDLQSAIRKVNRAETVAQNLLILVKPLLFKQDFGKESESVIDDHQLRFVEFRCSAFHHADYAYREIYLVYKWVGPEGEREVVFNLSRLPSLVNTSKSRLSAEDYEEITSLIKTNKWIR